MNLQQMLSRARRDEIQLTRIGIAESRRVTVQLRTRVLNAYLHGYQPTAAQLMDERMFRLLVDVMVGMHLKGEELARAIQREAIHAKMSERLTRILTQLANPRRVKQLQTRYRTSAFRILAGTSQRVEKTLRQTINQLIVDGVPNAQGVRILRQKFDDLGLTPKNGYSLETVYRTQSQIAYGAGRWEADQDPDIQDILWGYEYTTVGDDRVRPSHAALNGTRLPKDDPFWKRFWPPNGYNCRCTVIPIFDTATIKRPPRFVPGTTDVVEPDAGFAFNAGEALALSDAMETLFALAL